MFMLVFTRANNRVRCELQQLGLLSKLPWSGSRHLCRRSAQNAADQTLLCNTSNADDLVLGTIIHDNNLVINTAKVIFSIIYQHFTTLAFKLNLKPGKSAAMFCLR